MELPDNREEAKCCGGGGGLKAVDLDLSGDIAFKRVVAAIEAGAQVLVSACPSCKANLRLAADRARKEKIGKIKVMDISEVMKKALGKPPAEPEVAPPVTTATVTPPATPAAPSPDPEPSSGPEPAPTGASGPDVRDGSSDE